MALFPAYVDAKNSDVNCPPIAGDKVRDTIFGPCEVPEALEVQLLASDTEDEVSSVKGYMLSCGQAEIIPSQDFYFDRTLDRGNLRVSTLYYPGRPQYSYDKANTIGRKSKHDEKRWERYFSKRIYEESDMSTAERSISYRKLLTDMPDDLQLWESYIDFQEVCNNMQGALDAVRHAVCKIPESFRLRRRQLTLLRAVFPHRQYLQEIRDMIAAETRSYVRIELWAQLIASVGEEPEAVLRAALSDTVAQSAAAPFFIYAFGSYLRTAGLWERLVLAIELLVAMNFPAAARAARPFPPPRHLDVDDRLLRLEDELMNSGLPRHAVWTRVERARAGAHWCPKPRDDIDPQRAPLPHDVADLLIPLVGSVRLLHLAVRLLLLAKVPMIPSTEAWSRVAGEVYGTAEGLLSLAYAHHSSTDAVHFAKLLEMLTDPPHYFSDDTGFAGWVAGLWEACCAGCEGPAREALLCWRLRWLHARLTLIATDGPGGAATLRSEARGVLKRLAQSSPLAFAEFARLEASVDGGAERAIAAATHALRAVIADPDRPTVDALYVARAVGEVVGAEAGECALVHAVLRRTPPPKLQAPDDSLRLTALRTCEERCAALEESFNDRTLEPSDTAVLEALQPSVGEWARARLALATPSARYQLLQRLLNAQRQVKNTECDALRYYEDSACEMVERGGNKVRDHIHALAAHFPNNAYLNLKSAFTASWRSGALSVEERIRKLAAPRSSNSAEACLLPSLFCALRREWVPIEAEKVVRTARRVTSGAGGATCGGVVWAARLECEARAAAPRITHALLSALHHLPHDKWLHVRGAKWCGGEAESLSDALLEKQLRLHALPDELVPLVR
ncbi:unnamed protein product [Leptosia nina]|uniref:Uncharacterized protein n=1 Tax=Leptosia nina TaxID=320188 RepID=A0AAV1K3Q8_9NEOP